LRAGKRLGQHRENRTVGGSELGSLDLAAQHTELVAQDGDLHVLGVPASQAPEQDADEPACHEVEEGQSHRSILVYPGPCCSTHAAGFLNPAGYAELCEILADRNHPDHAERVDWLGHPHDPAAFDKNAINTSLARIRLG
jgi:Plasmid pRiA4b ORF-3-like protein